MKIIVKYSLIILLLCVSLSSLQKIQADGSEIHVVLDGMEIQFDVPPVQVNGYTYIPLRSILQTLGASIQFDPQTNIIVIQHQSNDIIYDVNSSKVIIDHETYSLTPKPIVRGNRTLVPLRFFSTAFGYRTDWDTESRTVTLNTVLPTQHADSSEGSKPVVLLPHTSQQLSPEKLSGNLFDVDLGLSIEIRNYAVVNNKLYTYLYISNSSKDHSLFVSFDPSNKKVIWQHNEKKPEMVPFISEDCTTVTPITTIDSTSGHVYTLPKFSQDQVCLRQNAEKLQQQIQGREKYQFTELGSDHAVYQTYIQLEDGSVQDFEFPPQMGYIFFILAPTDGNSSMEISGKYKASKDNSSALPFHLTYMTDKPVDFGKYNLIYTLLPSE
ncbi:copper amine oxidase N-terminal domain-containing protein [Paenibacillus puldeungensis]|uniref:Copper amine oxidase N-terminal domain-containing protein n=1 Tax=Paenibacillus puldeungensis TaxID=696536 RepID=A0ABW3RYE0_9BACL